MFAKTPPKSLESSIRRWPHPLFPSSSVMKTLPRIANTNYLAPNCTTKRGRNGRVGLDNVELPPKLASLVI